MHPQSPQRKWKSRHQSVHHKHPSPPNQPSEAKPKARKGKEKATNPLKKQRTMNIPQDFFGNPIPNFTSMAMSNNSQLQLQLKL